MQEYDVQKQLKKLQVTFCLITFVINQYTIDQVKEPMFLGVILDKNLSWKLHIARKVSKSTGIIYKAMVSAYLLQLYVPCTIVLFILTYFIALRYGAQLIHPEKGGTNYIK